MGDRYIWVSNYENVTDSALNEHINEHWNTVHLKRLGYNTSLYLIFRLGIILTTCLRAGTVWPILRRKWKTLSGSRVIHWVPDAQKSTESSWNPLGPFLHSGSLFSPRVDPLIFDLEASYINERRGESDLDHLDSRSQTHMQAFHIY